MTPSPRAVGSGWMLLRSDTFAGLQVSAKMCLKTFNDGYWNGDNCEYKRGYICKRRGEKRIYLSLITGNMLVNFSCSCRSACPTFVPTAGFVTALVCQDTSAVLHCPEGSVINVKSAQERRRLSPAGRIRRWLHCHTETQDGGKENQHFFSRITGLKKKKSLNIPFRNVSHQAYFCYG